MAKKKAAAKKPKKLVTEMEQPPIPGAEQSDKIPEVHNAALFYKQKQVDYGEAGDAMVEAKLKLIDKMDAHGITHYQHGNVDVNLTAGKVTVKVKIANAEDQQ